MAGILQTAFIVSYMLFAPLFGYLGDRYSRKAIMAGGVFLWSIFTLIGSFMSGAEENRGKGWANPDFLAFLGCRAMVGIGEASYSTIAPTIISDMFVKDTRSKMLALFYFAIPVGSGLGYIVGSETARIFGDWQWGLRATPVLGIVAVVLILFLLTDPPRGESEGHEDLRRLATGRTWPTWQPSLQHSILASKLSAASSSSSPPSSLSGTSWLASSPSQGNISSHSQQLCPFLCHHVVQKISENPLQMAAEKG